MNSWYILEVPDQNRPSGRNEKTTIGINMELPSLYQQDQSVPFETLFKNPGALYRDTPFWAWNCKLNEKQLREQIGMMQEMGMGGFHMHSRSGMATPYLSKEFFSMVKACVDEAKSRQMLAWLYDEDRFPSGDAGGFVTKDPAMRARNLEVRFQPLDSAPDPAMDNSGTLLECYLVKLAADGCLEDYRRCGKDESAPAGYKKIWCYLKVEENNAWYNDQAYVDTMNPKAIRRFVELTHEAYKNAVGKDFGQAVPAIFTDEPQFSTKQPLTFANEETPIALPYTNDLPQSYRETYHCDFFDTLPELIWELPGGKYSQARYHFHDHICERFAAGFSDVIGDWCRQNNLRSTGHVLCEETLQGQTSVIGEAMRCYRGFLLPGIDTLCDCQELTTAKQAQSVSRQFGRGGILSELDGVTDWDFDFASHKCHGDWQAALGVTVRVPHLAWVSMGGEAKRDYPASINYQSPWYKKYPVITDHFARVSAALTRGVPHCRVAVIHPIESYWLLWGPKDQTATAREQAEENFNNLFEWLLKGLVDFDLLSESLLPIQNVHPEDKKLCVGVMKYDVVVIPPTITLRSSTLDILDKFRQAGGRVIFAGDVATLCDALPSSRPAELAAKCEKTAYARASLLAILDEYREVRVINAHDGANVGGLLHQIRDLDNGQRILFLTRTERIGVQVPARVRLKGNWTLESLDTSNGSISPLEASIENGWTTLETFIYPHGHLLLRLTPTDQTYIPRTRSIRTMTIEESIAGDRYLEKAIVGRLSQECIPISLDEPNVLPLDTAEWRLDGGEWQPAEEILRIHTKLREKWGMEPKSILIVQPWVYPVSEKCYGVVELRYTIHAEVKLSGTFLALEQPAETRILLDGEPVAYKDEGYWTDSSMRKTRLPDMEPGDHTITFIRDYHDDTEIDLAYLLGDFGVKVENRRLTAVAPVRSLHWGNIGPQGLPFYSGNITYHTTFSTDCREPLFLRIPSRVTSLDPQLPKWRLCAREVEFAMFRGTMLDVKLDGKFAGDIAFAPYELPLNTLAPGEHQLDITLYGHRYNSFGSLHLTGRMFWVFSDTWHSFGEDFTYTYRTLPIGIMCEPLIIKELQRWK